MNTAAKTDFKSKTFYTRENYTRLREKEISPIAFKPFQKLFVVLISIFTILIFSESPRELEQICESYNSKELCNVW